MPDVPELFCPACKKPTPVYRDVYGPGGEGVVLVCSVCFRVVVRGLGMVEGALKGGAVR